MAGDVFPTSTGDNAVKTFFLDLLAIIGLAFQGGPAAAAGELLEIQQGSLSEHPAQVLTPAELASAVVKGAIDLGTAQAEARKSGYTADTFQGLIDIAGNPPGPGQILDLLNRGEIDEATARLGLRESYLRNDWVSAMIALRRSILPAGELVAAVVQAQLDPGDAAARAAQVGVNGDDFDVMVRTAGNPPGPTETLTMLQRNILSRDEATQALRESRLKDKWIPQFMELVRRRVPARTLTTFLNHGAISDAAAQQNLIELGYSPEDAAAYVASARATRAKANHDLSVAQIRELYVNRVMTRDNAVTALVTAGYTTEAANEILSLTDVLADHKVQAQAITNIRGRYVTRKITAGEASAALDGIGVPADQRDHLLSVWAFEQESNHATLTLAQISKAVKIGVMDPGEWAARVANMGYSDADVTTLAFVEGIEKVPAGGG